MRRRVLFLAISAVLVLLSIGLVVVRGINFGVDFRGGILIEARTHGPADLGDLRSRLNALGLGEVGLQQFGAPTDVLINFGEQPGGEKGQLATIDKVKGALGDTVSEYRRIEIVGPKVGAELVRDGIIATALAMAAIAAYVWFRFEWQFGVSALISLVHDVVTTLGLFSLFQLEFNLPTLAAVLTIAGYSINDTIVVFDRIRERSKALRKETHSRAMDIAVNETLSRTVITSLTVMLTAVALFVWGGEVLRDFSFAMLVGVGFGTYSSVYVASALALDIWIGLDRRKGVQAE